MDVPDMMLNWEGIIVAGTVPEDSSVGIHAASMFTPGALMSGCKYQLKRSCWFVMILNSIKLNRSRIVKVLSLFRSVITMKFHQIKNSTFFKFRFCLSVITKRRQCCNFVTKRKQNIEILV